VLAIGSAPADEVVPVGSEWKWLHPVDGVDPASSVPDFHKSFMKADFDDSKWKTGKDGTGTHAGFAYGEKDFAGVDIGTPAAENRFSAYFRHKFKTTKGFKDLMLKLQRDDGIIVYLDGKEVGRDNVGGADDAYKLSAADSVGSTENDPIELKLEGEIEPGDHILAISLHNRSGGSTDLRIAEISLNGTAK
jgi:hypothetical protein